MASENKDEENRCQTTLKQIEWLLTKNLRTDSQALACSNPSYGSLVDLNRTRFLLESVGNKVLTDIVGDFLDLLDHSTVVYESTGEYALDIVASGWCHCLKNASRNLCDTENDAQALRSGKWLCHESCWTDAAKPAIEKGQPVDIECHGGIRIYSVPIWMRNEVVGAVNFGYGNPPRDDGSLDTISRRFSVTKAKLRVLADSYEHRPRFIIDIAKNRSLKAASIIGTILERKTIEDSLKCSEERFRNIFERAGIGIFQAKPSGRFVGVNPALAEMLGYTCPEEVLSTITDISREVFADPEARRKILAAADENNNEVLKFVSKCYRKNGDVWLAELSMRLIRSENGRLEFIEGFAEDITSQREIEERLVRSEKLAVLGQLAGGVGHELRNPLASIKAAASFLKTFLSESEGSEREALSIIEREVNRSARVIEGLLNYARTKKAQGELVDVKRTIEDVLSQVPVPGKVRISWKREEAKTYIKADSAQFFQICDNIIRNAIEAMDDGGQLSISIHDDSPQWINISFEDDGGGIPKESIQSIFQPLFTTKEDGIGLGLAITRVLVERNQGRIQVESELGQGSTFQLHFPSANNESSRVFGEGLAKATPERNGTN